jgi:hypothetical protein
VLMDQSSWDDTLVDVGSPRPFPGEAVSFQSSRDKRQKLSPGKTSRGEGRAIGDRETDIAGWDRAEFWALVYRVNPRIPPSTRAFVEEWAAAATSDPHRLLADPRTTDLLTAREWRIKGRLARLSNARARENWSGPDSVRRMSFRWRDGGRVITDIAEGLRRA